MSPELDPELLATHPRLQPNLTALIEWAKADVKNVFADIVTGCPDVPELGHTHEADGWTPGKCEACKQDVWVGPETLDVWAPNPDTIALLCMPCAAGFANAWGRATGVEMRKYDLETGEFIDGA